MDNLLRGGDLSAVRALWGLDPDVTFLNHGSFGATPSAVLHEQASLRAEMEAQPVRFLDRELPHRLSDVRDEVSSFLDADPQGIAFVPNASTGVAAVLASLRMGPGDELLISDHAYNAVRLAAARACERSGATLRVAALDRAGTAPETDFSAFLTDRTRLAIIDQVVSWNGVVLDVAPVVSACKARNVPLLVDGAHAPGMIDVSLRNLSPDMWVGNLHKWVCAPKGAAILWVSEPFRDRIKPTVTSHGAERSFIDEFDWNGTYDPTAILAVPSAFRFLERLGTAWMRAYNLSLAAHARDVLSDALGVEPPWPVERQAFMAGVPLGAHLADKRAAVAFHAEVYERTLIEVPFMAWVGQTVLRASAQVYNGPEEYERLAAVLPSIRDEHAVRLQEVDA